MKLNNILFFILLSCSHLLFAQHHVEVIDSAHFFFGSNVVPGKTSFRGLSVVSNKVFWLSGNRGTVGRSTNGGKSVSLLQIPGYEKSDFRDIEAFDAQHAIVMSSGTPAYILTTRDGGQTWKEVFKDTRPEVFLDAMDFWDARRGVIIGDPVNGHFIILKTTDAGETWKALDTSVTPLAIDSEAIFAASGTSLRCWGTDQFGFVTGGIASRFIKASLINDTLSQLKTYGLPIHMGKRSTGAFSFCTLNDNVLVVGGDYANDTLISNNSVIMVRDKDIPACDVYEGFVTRKPDQDVKGYRSSVEAIRNGNIFIACGSSGVDIGNVDKWKNVSDSGFNVVRHAKKGKAVYLAGNKGRIAKLVY